jgi:hypothetical protein
MLTIWLAAPLATQRGGFSTSLTQTSSKKEWSMRAAHFTTFFAQDADDTAACGIGPWVTSVGLGLIGFGPSCRLRLILGAVLGSVLLLPVHAKGELLPRSLKQLQKSDLIVVGTISQLRIESERSSGLGNYDWGIYVTLTVEKVEKGDLTDTEIEFRCYRRKQRLTNPPEPSGHRPIPGTGTTVRAYLHERNHTWVAALPNGINAPDFSRLADAPEVDGLPRVKLITFFQSLDMWVLMFVVVALTILAILSTRGFIRRRKTRLLNATAG